MTHVTTHENVLMEPGEQTDSGWCVVSEPVLFRRASNLSFSRKGTIKGTLSALGGKWHSTQGPFLKGSEKVTVLKK